MKNLLRLIVDAAKNDDINRVIELAEKQQDKFCDNNCVWTDHHKECGYTNDTSEERVDKTRENVHEPEWYYVMDVHGCNRFYHRTEDCPYKVKTPLYAGQPLEQDEVDIRSRLYQRVHELECQLARQNSDVEWSDNIGGIGFDSPMPNADYKVIATVVPKQNQEPIAWLCQKDNGHFDVLTDQTCKKCFPVYTTPYVPEGRQQRKPLTDEQIEKLFPKFGSDMVKCVRAIEAAHGIQPDTGVEE